MTCKDCLHIDVCYKRESVSDNYAEKCGDCLTETSLHKLQCENCDALNEYNSLAKSLNTASELLRKKRPQGEWIVVKQDNEGIHEIKCPFCKYSKGSDFSSILIVTFERFPPFCENCGAQMVIKEDSKDG